MVSASHMLVPRFVFLFCLGLLLIGSRNVPARTPLDHRPVHRPAFDSSRVLPMDPEVRIGQLTNGLTYYIRTNDEPENRAELRLVVDAGSVLEDESQRGLAHFLEHMLFNGTRRFPEQKLVDFLERIGMRFGPDVNASTSFDETVYMLTIPTDSARIVEQAFDVLEDWAAHATLSDEEIDKERGVVIEEWRLNQQNAQGRLLNEILPVYLYGSRYQHRLPIGDTTVIKQADYDAVRRFYRDWYRPDLMAVIAVGDFNPDRIEQLIREHFRELRSPENPRPRGRFPVPGHDGTLFKIATDPEYPVSTVEIIYTQEAEPLNTVDDYHQRLTDYLFYGMLNERLAEIARRPDAPFLGAQAYHGDFVRSADVYGLQARVQDDSLLVGLKAILTEAARVRRFGFTDGELVRQKKELIRRYEQAFNERENTNSASYAGEYVSHFLESDASPGIEYEIDLVRAQLPTISLEQINQLAEQLLVPSNRAVIVTMPEKEETPAPTEQQLQKVIRQAETQSLTAYEDDTPDSPLLPIEPEPADILDEKALPEIGVTEFTLSNGVRVVMKPTTFKADEIRFTASSAGGSSLVSDEDAFEADIADMLVVQSGVGPFDRTHLERLLAGKLVTVSPFISELEEGFSGSASPQDLETLFQLIHLYVTAPRADSTALAMLQNQYRAALANRSSDPIAVFQDTLQAALYGNHPRYRVATVEMVDSLAVEDAFRIYRNRFADLGDFTFVFAGSFDPDSLRMFARQYLGTLPSLNRKESWRDVKPDLPSGIIMSTVARGMGQQSQAAIVFNGPFQYGRENRYTLRSMAEALSIRLREVLREDLGGVYGVGVSATSTDRPDSEYTVTIRFGADPRRVDELISAVFDEIERFKREGPGEEIAEKIREQQHRERETAMETNAFWVNVLDYYYTHPDEPVTDILDYPRLIDSLDAGDLRNAARAYLNADRYVKVVLMPERVDP